MDRERPRVLRPAVIAGTMLAANLVLAAALAAVALRPRPVLVLPSARAAEELLPGEVPQASAREFGLRYVVHFDNFTPGTLTSTESVLRSMVSPRAWSRAEDTLLRRRKLVEEGRLSSQVVPLSADVEGLRVTVRALRRIFISDRLSRESRPTYRVQLERQPPTAANPYGLAVVSQEIEEAE